MVVDDIACGGGSNDDGGGGYDGGDNDAIITSLVLICDSLYLTTCMAANQKECVK